jgi:hypothetical protein
VCIAAEPILCEIARAKHEAAGHSVQIQWRKTMNRMNIFIVLRSGRLSAVVALVGLGLLFAASGAKAGCAPTSYKLGAAPSTPAASVKADGGQYPDGFNNSGSIVGLWHVLYTAKTNDGFAPGGVLLKPPFLFLESFKTWHADGTEFENAFLPPTDGNICFGVWDDQGHGKVHLHHVGLMFQPGGAPPTFVTNIFTVDEDDVVAPDGKTYSGTFDFKLFVPSQCANTSNGTYACTGTPLAEVTGTTGATRITAH